MLPKRPEDFNPVAEAVRMVGGLTKAAHLCEVSFHAVYKWRRDRKIPNSRAVFVLSEATGGRITARELAGFTADFPGGEAQFDAETERSDGTGHEIDHGEVDEDPHTTAASVYEFRRRPREYPPPAQRRPMQGKKSALAPETSKVARWVSQATPDLTAA
jgi:hypothetical protein